VCGEEGKGRNTHALTHLTSSGPARRGMAWHGEAMGASTRHARE
jgi:hypothetical protein